MAKQDVDINNNSIQTYFGGAFSHKASCILRNAVSFQKQFFH